ncbi:alpha/beta fold hydrolase [Cytobacillus massiliigabonensis]|uniref:alpha/beta fold hydrolase n=1 Tax=Cytobacillus massiliigabonensis TaxID=1871011 RepID=UPI000C825A07|nr:alpha/beta hydrolase [Cytobacillus massiliigabonensis]
MAYCKVTQAEIYYEDIGEGKPIIMIHGFSPDHRLMSGCMEPVFKKRTGWRRIYIDLPGMGLTKNYNEIGSSDEMLTAVLEFIQTIIPGQEYLIAGESYGGYIARGIIQKQQEQILGAAFICPVIIPLAEDRTAEEHKILKTDEKFLAKLSTEELEDFRSNNVVLDEYTWLRYNREIVSGCKIADEKLLNNVKDKYGFSFEIDQFNFNKPSVFLLGRQDSSVGYKDALKLIDKYPRGTFTVLDHAGHNLQIEQPQLFNTLVDEWLDRIEYSVD